MCGAHVLIYYYSPRNEAKGGGGGGGGRIGITVTVPASFMVCIMVDLLVDSKDGEL